MKSEIRNPKSETNPKPEGRDLKGWFESKDQVARLERAAIAWVGTPFVAHGSVRGAGVDCVHLVAAIYAEVGFLPAIAWPAYTMDGGIHNRVSQIRDWLEHSERFELVAHPLSKAGDVLCFQVGRSAHHAGLRLSGLRFIHCMFRRAVTVADLGDPTYRRMLVAVYRPVEAAR